jgi:hypothetical protein
VEGGFFSEGWYLAKRMPPDVLCKRRGILYFAEGLSSTLVHDQETFWVMDREAL